MRDGAGMEHREEVALKALAENHMAVRIAIIAAAYSIPIHLFR